MVKEYFNKNDKEKLKVLEDFISLCETNEQQTPFYFIQGKNVCFDTDDNGLKDDVEYNCDCESSLDCNCEIDTIREKHDPIFNEACISLFQSADLMNEESMFFDDFNYATFYERETDTIKVAFTRKSSGAFLKFDFKNASDACFTYGIGKYKRELGGFTIGEKQNQVIAAFLQHHTAFRCAFPRVIVDASIGNPCGTFNKQSFYLEYDCSIVMELKPTAVVFYGFQGLDQKKKFVVPFSDKEMHDFMQYTNDVVERLKTVHCPAVVNAQEAVRVSEKRYRDDVESLNQELQKEKQQHEMEVERLCKIQKVFQK